MLLAAPPYLSPRWAGGADAPRRLVLIAGTLATAIAAAPSVRFLPEMFGGPADSASLPWVAAVTFTTAVVGYVLLRRATAQPTRAASIRVCLVVGALGGALNAGLTFGAALAYSTIVDRMPFGLPASVFGAIGAGLLGFLVGLVPGAMLGAPMGIVYGAAYVPLVVAARAGHGSHAAVDRALVRCSLWTIATVSLGTATLGTEALERPYVVVLAAAVATVVGAVGVLLGALARLRAREGWLLRVRTGAVPGVRIVESADGPGTVRQPLAYGAGPAIEGALLVRERPGGGASYRTTPALEVLASLAPAA